MFLDLNPISHWGHLTLFWPPDSQDECFPQVVTVRAIHSEIITRQVCGGSLAHETMRHFLGGVGLCSNSLSSAYQEIWLFSS